MTGLLSEAPELGDVDTAPGIRGRLHTGAATFELGLAGARGGARASQAEGAESQEWVPEGEARGGG